ncbi:MAG: TolC family protein [Elusimicrobia bacterium]|nr:TolC family protein [Elusimicrobiota bacterium]
MVTLEDGRQLFAWQTETRSPNAGSAIKIGQGVVNFAPYTLSFSRKITSFFAKYNKQSALAAVGTFFTALLHAVETDTFLISLDGTGFVVLLIVGLSLLLIPLVARESNKHPDRPSDRRIAWEMWIEDHNPFNIFKGMTVKRLPALLLALVFQFGGMAPAAAAFTSAPTPTVAEQQQAGNFFTGGLQTLNEIVAKAVQDSATHLMEGSGPAKESVGTVKVTVEKGMTLGGLYQKLKSAGTVFPGISSAAEFIAAVVDINKLTSAHFIKAGQVLELPGFVGPVSVSYQAPAVRTPTSAVAPVAAPATSQAETPDISKGESGPARGVPIKSLEDVSQLIRESLLAQHADAKLEAARLRQLAENPIVQAAPGVGVEGYVGPEGSGASVEVASRVRSDSIWRAAEAERWANFTEADMELMVRDQTRRAGEALLSYRALSETLKIKRDSLRAMEAVRQKGTPDAGANFNQAIKVARDEVQLLAKAEREAGRVAKNLLGLQAKDDLRVRGALFTGIAGQNLDVYEARLKANTAKIQALAQELGTEGADQVAKFFKETMGIEASASWFKEAGKEPLPQLGLSIDLKALNKGDIKKEFAERIEKAIELFNLKAANDQLRVEASLARDHAVQQIEIARENAKEARKALAAAEAFLKDQMANYTDSGGAEGEAGALVRAFRLREEALIRVLAVQTAEVQARAQYRFAGRTDDPANQTAVSAPLGSDDTARLNIQGLIDTALKQRLGFMEKDIEQAAVDGGWDALMGRMDPNFKISGTFYKGGSPVSLSVSVLLSDSNAETKAERAKVAMSRAHVLVLAARNQVVSEVTSSYLGLRDAQESRRLAHRAEDLQTALRPTDSSHPDYFYLNAQSEAGHARLFDAQSNELAAWRNLQAAVGVGPAQAGAMFQGLLGEEAHDPTHAVEVARDYYDPKADKAMAAVMKEQIEELGLTMATNMDQYWDPKIGFAVIPSGGFVPMIWTDRLANIPAMILSPLTWPFRAMAGDTRLFVDPLGDRIAAETALATGQRAVAQDARVLEQGDKKAEFDSAARTLESAEKRVKEAEGRLKKAVDDLSAVQERARQGRASSPVVVRQKMVLVDREAREGSSGGLPTCPQPSPWAWPESRHSRSGGPRPSWS